MTTPAQFTARASRDAGRSPRRHHWWRWILGGLALFLVLLIGGVVAAIKLQPSPAPLALPTGTVSAPSGSLNGTWQAGSGSAAGFRIRETALWMGNDVVGRTNAVTGIVVIAGDRVQSGSCRINKV